MSIAEFESFSHAFPWFFPVAVFLFGACIGSFLNVCIYRIPAEKSIVTPGSHCGCGKPIAWFDNIPILSWVFLRGRARCCGRPFSIRYPAIELLTACLFLACWMLFPAAGHAKAICGWVLVSALICATFIDLDQFIIPDVFTIGLGLVGVVLSLLLPPLHVPMSSGIYVADSLRSGVASIQGMLIGAGLVVWIAVLGEAVFKKEAMGFGDVKLVGAIGAFTGWQGAVFTLFGGACVGCVWFFMAWGWQKIAGKSAPVLLKTETAEGEATALGSAHAHVPFGPMLCIAAILYFLWLYAPVADYLSVMDMLL